MRLQYLEVQAKKILNVHPHVDGPWFWGKYSAHPYVGCRHGCEFCYARGQRYLGTRDPDTFDTLLQVKTNAVELFRRELSRQMLEGVTCGDWQAPAETRYRLSRGMLEVVYERRFPVYLVERSPLLLRDLDLLQAIHRQSFAGVIYSISSVDERLKQAFEPRSPGTRRRLKAVSTLASAGLEVGVALMPILPGVGDDEAHLSEAIRAVADHGGRFLMAGPLTLEGVQAVRTLEAVRRVDPKAVPRVRGLYRWAEGGTPAYAPSRRYASTLGLRVRALCERHGLKDRMPRYVGSSPLSHNKRLAEHLFNRTYDLELELASFERIRACRQAAWVVDELLERVSVVLERQGEGGFSALTGLDETLTSEIRQWLSRHPEPEGEPGRRSTPWENRPQESNGQLSLALKPQRVRRVL